MEREGWRERNGDRETVEAAIFLPSPREMEREGWRERNGERERV